MRVVADGTLPICNRLMLTFICKQLVFKITMATQTEQLLWFQVYPFVITGVGIMAGQTFTFFVGIMDTRRFLLEETFLVAGRTEFFPFSFEKQFIVCTMTEMTGGTLPGLQRSVNIGSHEFCFQSRMAGIADTIRSVDENILCAGAMRVMTAGTHIFCKWAVLIVVFRPVCPRFSMALVTQLPVRFIHQPGIGSGVG